MDPNRTLSKMEKGAGACNGSQLENSLCMFTLPSFFRHWMNYHLKPRWWRGVTARILLIQQAFPKSTGYQRHHFTPQAVAQRIPTQLHPRTQSPVSHLILGSYIPRPMLTQTLTEVIEIPLLAYIQRLMHIPFEVTLQLH